MTFAGDATSVAVDSDDNVYVFNRGPVPIMIFDRYGNFLSAWGEGEFDRSHAIFIDLDDNLYLVDSAGHFVQKRTPEGRVLLTIGRRGQAAEFQSGVYFNQPTDVAVDPKTGDIFVTDGYGNSRVHRFDLDGRHIQSWGTPGSEEGQFSLPHGISLTLDGRLIVCDRENYRVQVFTIDGEFLAQWHMHHPAAIRQSKTLGNLYIAEMGSPFQYGVPNLGCCVWILTPDGERIAQLGSPIAGTGANEFVFPHGIAVDSHGDIYIAECSNSYLTRIVPAALRPAPPSKELPSLRKWRNMINCGN